MLIFCDLRVLGCLTGGHTELSLSFVAFLLRLRSMRKWPSCTPPANPRVMGHTVLPALGDRDHRRTGWQPGLSRERRVLPASVTSDRSTAGSPSCRWGGLRATPSDSRHSLRAICHLVESLA